MTDTTQNSNQSAANADNATATETVGPLVPELGPNGVPVNPQGDDQGDGVDHNFLLDTFFGEGQSELPNSGEGQGKGSNSSDGQQQAGSLAPQPAAPAANGGEVSPPVPGASPTQQPGQNEQNDGAGKAAQTPGQGQAQPSPEPAPAPQLSVEDRLRLASAQALEQQNRELLERLRRFEQGGQQPQPQGQGGQQAPTTQPAGGQEPPLRLAVPDALYNAVFDENPQTSRQALDVLITAVAQNAVNHVLQRVEPLIDQKLSMVTQAVEGQKKVSEMERQYFDRFPTHNNQLYRPVIQAAVDEKFKAFPYAQWDETMMDAVGATVNEKLKALGIDPSSGQGKQEQTGQNGQGQQQANGTQRQKPAPMLDGSTRTGGDKVPNNAGDFIRSTFG